MVRAYHTIFTIPLLQPTMNRHALYCRYLFGHFRTVPRVLFRGQNAIPADSPWRISARASMLGRPGVRLGVSPPLPHRTHGCTRTVTGAATHATASCWLCGRLYATFTYHLTPIDVGYSLRERTTSPLPLPFRRWRHLTFSASRLPLPCASRLPRGAFAADGHLFWADTGTACHFTRGRAYYSTHHLLTASTRARRATALKHA